MFIAKFQVQWYQWAFFYRLAVKETCDHIGKHLVYISRNALKKSLDRIFARKRTNLRVCGVRQEITRPEERDVSTGFSSPERTRCSLSSPEFPLIRSAGERVRARRKGEGAILVAGEHRDAVGGAGSRRPAWGSPHPRLAPGRGVGFAEKRRKDKWGMVRGERVTSAAGRERVTSGQGGLAGWRGRCAPPRDALWRHGDWINITPLVPSLRRWRRSSRQTVDCLSTR